VFAHFLPASARENERSLRRAGNRIFSKTVRNRVALCGKMSILPASPPRWMRVQRLYSDPRWAARESLHLSQGQSVSCVSIESLDPAAFKSAAWRSDATMIDRRKRSSSDGRPLIGSEPTRREVLGWKVRGGRLHCPSRKIKKERFKLRRRENPAKLGDLPGHSVHFICLSLRLTDAAVLPHLQLVSSRRAIREKWLSFRRSSAVYSCDQ